MHDVAIMDEVVFSFKPHFSGFLRPRLAAIAHKIIVGDGFGPDEALLEIRMNDAGRLRGERSLTDGPSSGLFRAGGKVGGKT
jgi:hypothetical protein